LQDARLAAAYCPCPHHGTRACDCQMVVLLVYGNGIRPATLILHSNDGQTWLSLVNTPSQPVEQSISDSIESALDMNSSTQGL